MPTPPASSPTPDATIADTLDSDWSRVSQTADLHFVSGKGGTGKTTVAAALALALASRDKKVLLVEVEERQGLARLFDRPSLPYREELLARVDGGGEVHALAIDINACMLEYLDRFYKLGVVGRAMRSAGAIEFATTIAPGLKDVLLTGKVYEVATRDPAQGETSYDAVIVDSPPTGRIGKFLDVTTGMADIAKGGPVYRQAQSVQQLIHSSRTVVHLVTLLESLPVQETIEAIAELEAIPIRVGELIINRASPRYLDDDALRELADGGFDSATLAEGLEAADLDHTEADLEGLAIEAIEHARVSLSQLSALESVRETGYGALALPMLADGVEVTDLYDLASRLIEQGVR